MSESAPTLSGWERALMTALEGAGIEYAVVGGNAVAEWIARVDEDAVRNTRDVDILVQRSDFPAVKAALEAAGFHYHKLIDVDVFVDGPQGRPSGGVHLLFAGEKVQQQDFSTCPELSESEKAVGSEIGMRFQVVALEALVRMKLNSNRRKDQVHLEDMFGVGLIDASWPARFPPELAARLQHVLDTPGG